MTDRDRDAAATRETSMAAGAATAAPGSLTRRAVMQLGGAAILASAGATGTSGAWSLWADASAGPAVPAGPREVRAIENVWIPMPDGTRIAARLWLPADAEHDPVPALVEYIPYRKRDNTRLGDERHHPYLASFGYACVRPDIRGAGDSEGPVQDEYIQQEQDDAVAIIAWLAKQPWCTGKVGMFGISWGGFSALQVAAQRPPALKAIITHCSTDDRYTDDAHYLGGCVVSDMFGWGSMHTTNVARPPDPAIVGPRWRDMWRRRLEGIDFYVGNWLSHQSRDAFWKHASVDEDYGRIECAVYAVGGWVDAYSSAIPRMLAGLKTPRKGLIGPWGHQYPYAGAPGPAIDWLTEALRWWDHWLKGRDTGIMQEPMYRVWMQDEPALRGAGTIAGRWVAEDAWPSPRTRTVRYHLNDSTLEAQAHPETVRVLRPLQTVGITAPHWCPFNMATELPTDQSIDDARALAFDSPPLAEPFEILGAAVVNLELSVDRPVAFLSVRLNEVSPDGVSRRVTYGVLNLCHRNGHASPAALEPGKRYAIRLQLRDMAHSFKRGSRLRVALSTTAWPLIWPSPEPVTLTLYTGSSTLELPVRPPRDADSRLAAFGAPFIPDNSAARTVIEPPSGADGAKVFQWDVAGQRLVSHSRGSAGRYRINATGTEVYGSWDELSEISEHDPTSARLTMTRSQGFQRADWHVRVETALRLSLTREHFLLTGEMNTFEDDKPFFSRTWERKIPREFV